MGFNFRIGQLTTQKTDDGIEYDVDTVTLSNAPADGSPTDHTNQRWPSYSGWHEFTQATNLQMLFGHKIGELIPEHPGYAIITKRHQVMINTAYARKNKIHTDHHGRLEWLKFWVDWALENCSQPAFVNS